MVEKPKLKRDWEGRYVRLLRDVRNGHGTIFDAGTIMRVKRNYGGLDLENLFQCPICRQRRLERVSKVPEGAVELLPEDYRPEPIEPEKGITFPEGTVLIAHGVPDEIRFYLDGEPFSERYQSNKPCWLILIPETEG